MFAAWAKLLFPAGSIVQGDGKLVRLERTPFSDLFARRYQLIPRFHFHSLLQPLRRRPSLGDKRRSGRLCLGPAKYFRDLLQRAIVVTISIEKQEYRVAILLL